MTLEQLVTDLATSQRLHDAGFPQDTAMVWIAVHELDDDNDEPTLFPRVDALDDEGVPMWNFVAAPTAGELEEWLMTKLSFSKRLSSIVIEWVLLHAKDKEATYRVTGTGIGGLRIIVGKTAIAAALAALVLEVAG